MGKLRSSSCIHVFMTKSIAGLFMFLTYSKEWRGGNKQTKTFNQRVFSY